MCADFIYFASSTCILPQQQGQCATVCDSVGVQGYSHILICAATMFATKLNYAVYEFAHTTIFAIIQAWLGRLPEGLRSF